MCQLDARERQEMTDRRLVSKWLHLKPGAKLSALKIFTRPCSVPPLCITSAEGGQVHLVAWEQDLIKCSGLVVWDMGHSLRSFRVGRERGSHKSCVARTHLFSCSLASPLCKIFRVT